MRNFLFILMILITSCGYQPIYINKNPDNFKFQKLLLQVIKKSIEK